MKKIFLICILVLFLVSFVNASYYAKGAKISITSISPNPVKPGDYFNIYFKLENAVNYDLTNIKVKFVDNYPFSVVSGEKEKSFGMIRKDDTVYFDYKVKVADDAVGGIHNLRLDVYSGSISETIDNIEINVKSREAIFDIASLVMNPDPIAPGKVSKVYLTIRNQESTSMYDVNVKLDLSLSLLQASLAATAASLNDEIPLVNIGSSEEKKIAFIGPNSEATLEYDIMAYPNAESRVYKVPLIITYSDSTGTNYTKNNVIGIVVGDKPDLMVGVEDTNIFSKGGLGDITFKIINKGSTDVKFLTVTLDESENYKILGNQDIYVGSVDSDDYETVDYRIDLKTRNSKVEIPLKLSYKDANNKEYIDHVVVDFNIYSAAQLGKQQGNKSGSIIFVIIVIAVVYFLGYRKWKKSMKGKSDSLDLTTYTKFLISKIKMKKK